MRSINSLIRNGWYLQGDILWTDARNIVSHGGMDRFLSVYIITKKEMQLVGLTSLLLASKYEDFWHPKVKDLISISADS
uniref:Cyclin N-terminal domain-containing protein n=1 Tax=Nelumbo nucifera TaxID=4432 RepID=A0A822YVY2_NELNU|nr:TPA_asm: hypothetical protein HUJ06_007338 [Nelumbo nucifera]